MERGMKIHLGNKPLGGLAVLLLCLLVLPSCKKIHGEDTVKIGLLHSMSGTMAISEIPVMDAELLAVKEINEAGGVLGRKIEVIEEDGESSPQIFVEKVKKLLEEDSVASIFGCWTSASRKAVKTILEEDYGLLWYPLQYEGMEASPNIMYTGASPNQQVVPAIDYCIENEGRRIFLLGSDYVYPRTTNDIINAQLKTYDIENVGEVYLPLGHTDFSDVIDQILRAKPDIVVNTLNGDSNLAFFQLMRERGITADDFKVMSFSICEQEIKEIGSVNLEGHLTAWNYYQTDDNAQNRNFVESFKREYGQDSVTGDPLVSAYTAVHLWVLACEKAGSFDVEAVRIAAKGLSFDGPGGKVTVDGSNQHLYKTVRIGRINGNGLIDELWSTPEPIKPDPYLSSYYWAWGLKDN